MNKKFIQLYDCKARIYIVNIDKISAIDVDRSKVWVGEVLLEINQNSIKRLLDMLVGDFE